MSDGEALSARSAAEDNEQQQALDESQQQQDEDEQQPEDAGEEEQQPEEGDEEAVNESTADATDAAADPSSPLDSPSSSQQPDASSSDPSAAEPSPTSDSSDPASQPPSQPATDRSTAAQPNKEEEESKEEAPVRVEDESEEQAQQRSTGNQADAPDDEAENENDVSTANAGAQVGDEQLELLEQSHGQQDGAEQGERHLSQHVAEDGSFEDSGPSIPVEITILPDGFKHVESIPLRESIHSLKSVLSERFKLPPEQMRLALGDLVLEDERAVGEYREFEINRNKQRGMSEEEALAQPLSFVLNIELQDGEGGGADGVNGGEQQEDAGSQYRMPDILKVVINREELELEAEEEEEKEMMNGGGGDGTRPATERTPEQVVYVQVIRDNLHHPKPFLGGFRHKYYGTIYHHSSTQTARKKKKMESVKFHRETQTIQIISRSQQTNREAGTQMERRDLLQNHENDKVIMSKPYFTADELEALRDLKARELQCFLRQCFAWRRVRRLRETKAEMVEREMKERAAKMKREAEEHAKQIQRRMHPRTKEDFAVLFAELEAWRLHETQRIKESGLGHEEISAALQELLNKEVKLLQTIDRLKITAAKENKWSRTQSSLEKMASPKEWSSSEGDLIEVETPFTTRAKELVDLYNGLCLRNLSRAQRVDVLLHIKYTVKEFDCELSREIVELIKREEDLLRRQRSEASLEGCRKRLQNLFLQFVNTPAFNPEAANFQRVPPPPEGGQVAPPPALSSSLSKPSMLTKTNTITVATNVAGRIFSAKKK